MVRPTRIELVAYSLGGCRSIQLSYERAIVLLYLSFRTVSSCLGVLSGTGVWPYLYYVSSTGEEQKI